MKKIILVLVSYITTVSAVTGQTVDLGLKAKNGEIYQTIMRSKEANIGHGIFDPNKIQVGDYLTFKFADGFDTTYTVEAGDNQWTVVKGMLNSMPKMHGDVINYYPADDTTADLAAIDETPGDAPWEMPGWLKAVLLLLLLGFVGWLITYLVRKKQNEDPALSGRPMIPGGVSRVTVHDAMSQSVARELPGANITIQRIEEGTLDSNGHAVPIGYADRDRNRVLRNEPGFRATVLVAGDPTPRFMYTLQRCGNDIRTGGGLQSEHITFTPLATDAEVPNPATVAAPAQTSEAESISASNPMDFQTLIDGLPDIVSKVNETDNGIQMIFKNSSVNFTCTIRPGSDKDEKKEA